MGILKSIWKAAKRAVRWTWNHVVRPVAERIADMFGVAREKTRRTLDAVEVGAMRVERVLETEVGPVLGELLKRLDRELEAWLLRTFPLVGEPLIRLKRALQRIVSSRHRPNPVAVEAVVERAPDMEWER